MNGKQRMARQSKQWLVDALVTLMKDEAIEDISITEIVQTADLSRRTFYRAFKTKDDLIDYLCRQLADDYFKSLKASTRDQTPISFATTMQNFFTFWWQQKDLVRLLIRQGLFDRLNGVWQQNAVAHYRDFPAPWHPQGTDQEVNYIMAFALGGLTNILRLWLVQAHPESPEEIQRFAQASFAQLARSLGGGENNEPHEAQG